tara:strand:+ start:592 stop:717 length:126 start_codon:yes stop_codon:yes gene_type:complete
MNIITKFFLNILGVDSDKAEPLEIKSIKVTLNGDEIYAEEE